MIGDLIMDNSNIIAKRLKSLRESKGYKQNFIAEKIGIKSNTLSGYESGTRRPDAEILAKLADIYDVSTDYIIGRTDKKRYYDLTEKDQKEIDKELEEMISNLDSESGYSKYNDGDPMTDEDRELLKISLENSLRVAKQLAKKKFTPKKYR